MKKLSQCDYVIKIHDVFYWEKKQQGIKKYIIWIKLDLGERSLEDDIKIRKDQKRPYL